MSELPPESPSEDVMEQRADVYPGTAVRAGDPAMDAATEADPADVADQTDELPLDEDDYQ
jgi:hypothetical protein